MPSRRKAPRIPVLLALLAVLAVLASCRDEGAPRGRLARQLRSLGWAPYVDPDGDLRAIVALENGRSQKVGLSSRAADTQGWEVRELWSVAASFPQGLPEGLAEKLLDDSWSSRSLGAWVLAGPTSDGSVLVLYLVRIDARAPGRVVGSAVRDAASAADAMERALVGGDAF